MNTQNNPINKSQIDELLAAVASKMGKTPETLTQELQSGSLPHSEQIRELMGDKEKLGNLLQNPQVQQLLTELRKK